MTPSEKNALAVNQYLNFLADVLQQRLKNYFGKEPQPPRIGDIMKIVSIRDDSGLSTFIRNQKMTAEEILVLILALTPHVRPALFDSIIEQNISSPGDFPQLGGIRGKQFRGFIPSGETALFLLAGDDLAKRFEFSRLFSSDHYFSQRNLIWLDGLEQGDPPMSSRLEISRDCLELFIQGRISRPRISMDFPAEFISTELTNDDLVLAPSTLQQIAELENWIRYQDTVMNNWNMKRWIKSGYRVLFHGPPGTGKTLTALIIGKNTGRDVFRIDLSMVVSKFIGETEKNLSQLFERAQSKDWILFFDEADALFGKRTNVRDAHDKYANQEVAYLLQRIENHNGLVILASNFKTNIDDAFIRRFQSVIHFPLPTPAERLQLWKKALPSTVGLKLPSDTDLSVLSRKYEISGAGIVNVVQYCCLDTLTKKINEISVEQLKTGIEREYQKEGKVF